MATWSLPQLLTLASIVGSAFGSASSSAKCCFSKWGDAKSCGNYPATGHGGLCSTDWSKSCHGSGSCPTSPTPPTPPTPSSGPQIQIDPATAYKAAFDPQGAYSGHVRGIYGAMNGPVPIPIASSQYASFNYTAAQEAQYHASYMALGSATRWVRFNDVGETAMLSISQIFKAWPQTAAALQALDSVEPLAADLSNYNFSGVDKYVQPAVAAGRNLNWRIGDGWGTASSLKKGSFSPIWDPSVVFPAKWKFITDYSNPKGLALYAAVAAELAAHIHQLFLEHRQLDTQMIVFDVLTETSNEEECVFWPGTGSEYASLVGVVVPAVKSKLGATPQVRYAAANSAFGASYGKAYSYIYPKINKSDKRLFFQDFLVACNNMGPSKCPIDIIAFHPFQQKPSSYTEMMTFAQSAVNQLMTNFTTKPMFALTAWAQHGSGMFDINDNLAGANMMADILLTVQDFPIEFCIYYKFDGWNDQDPHGPSLTLLDGVLKPTAMPFVLMSRLLNVSSARKAASCSNGDQIAAVATDKVVSAVLTGNGTNSASIQLKSGFCAGQSATLLVENVAESEDVSCTKISINEACSQGIVSTKTVTGSISSTDGCFYTTGSSSKYVLPLEGAYVARVTISCSK